MASYPPFGGRKEVALHDDVAETLGCSERTVRRILDRLRLRLEQTLTDQDG